MRNKLVKASIWAKSQFAENSIPDRKTIKKWIEKGKIKGLVDDDGALWVYENEIFGVDRNISNEVSKLMEASA
ncbi:MULTISPECIES: hypothetical protein [unclassified Gilliamella]|uniref:hypothetical protein n=1 Tax=unclassified Gilliamella TaxID=2685620 RepID=UPI002269C742|nr:MULTISPECIES: hypothetical protein [unclassified Gilliamella]MCX8602429.1 hypothetical protein [Gilliamella sp. B3722]MCX8607761.1 hypothetical protein [Gilliamella sp. B3771]MCX8611588.1 hypothetical protein [Gilliamella sp. B3891]MCX8614144.1 hypothetical protein [Gilliamella sp. B3773]MCX8621412.1 hypothetical protein [Gilliamella sp. B3892]